MLSTQMKVFRGRKFNTIRGRDDSNVFYVAEMYLGVMIVAISVFLLPTLAMFYFYAFISIIVSVMILQILLICVQIVSTEFPYFELALSLSYPFVLPNGIKFEVKNSSDQQTIHIQGLKNNMGSCFSQLSNEIAKLLGGSNRSLWKEIFGSIIRGRSLLKTMINLLSI